MYEINKGFYATQGKGIRREHIGICLIKKTMLGKKGCAKGNPLM